MISWLRDQGATQVKVGDIAVVFGPVRSAPAQVDSHDKKATFDPNKNPIGGDIGVDDDLLLRSA